MTAVAQTLSGPKEPVPCSNTSRMAWAAVSSALQSTSKATHHCAGKGCTSMLAARAIAAEAMTLAGQRAHPAESTPSLTRATL
eukprot:CAMPEP_0181174520 /NCGR_PEP_ID=MMETSP1096-20121128/3582_1 /TAXON_ID=156174 ORGANISM="Chrysochromulina ericina, Strain CCMP281" /NCGR_SAMPLE_ID=MMETSP1096 /ASSEMBLY_ACC=CAM_ASM_000453 /LENGTH=82 /DNA_ID=CAMNT_0023262431 /DNA_START=278 /DNA_END=523 /DNA_ORIENTATION=+